MKFLYIILLVSIIPMYAMDNADYMERGVAGQSGADHMDQSQSSSDSEEVESPRARRSTTNSGRLSMEELEQYKNMNKRCYNNKGEQICCIGTITACVLFIIVYWRILGI